MKFTVVETIPKVEWNNGDSHYRLTGAWETEIDDGDIGIPLFLKDFAGTLGWKPFRKQNPKTFLMDIQYFFTREDSIVKDTLRRDAKSRIEFDKLMLEAIYNLKDDDDVQVDIEFEENDYGFKPRPYQKTGIVNLLTSMNLTDQYGYTRGHLLGDDMGLGKTYQVSSTIGLKKDLQRILIICPSSVKFNWPKELRYALSTGDPRFNKDNPHFPSQTVFDRNKITILGGDNQQVGRWINIINYDLVRRKAWFKKLAEVDWDLIVLDESHKIKTATSSTTKSILALKKKYAICMTGTPLDVPKHLMPQLAFLCPNRFGNIEKMVKQYGSRVSLKNLKSILQDMKMITMRKKSEVAKDLPAMITTINAVETPVELKKKISNLVLNEHEIVEYANEVERTSRELMYEMAGIPEDDHDALRIAQERFDTILNRMLAKAPEWKMPDDWHISTLRSVIASYKVDVAISRINTVISDGTTDNLVVFYHHKLVGAALAIAFPQAITINGTDSAESKDRKARQFRERKSNMIFCSITSVAEGVNLLGTYALFVEIDWRATTNSQAAARNHRIGQKFPCTNEILVFSDTLDAHMSRIYSVKMSNISSFAS